jgi:ribosome-associated toxin RatA of RatAB toxin-antitoxin module
VPAFYSIETVPHSGTVATGGRTRARRWILPAVAALSVVLNAHSASAASDPSQDVTVREQGGVYTVTAQFAVPQAPPTVTAVLTDFEHIPRFMPDVQKSVVLERAGEVTVVEQEAVARMLMFSKRIYLLLEVREGNDAIRFRDRSARSFTRYEGTWEIVQAGDRTVITYTLVAHPSFEVPEFFLGRLLKRDAKRMIEALRNEISGPEVRVQ